MDLNLILVCVVIAVALFFSYTNGFHDAANAIATSVSTRAWTPRAALLMAATMNVIGAMMGTGVAKTVGSGIIKISGYAESTSPDMQQRAWSSSWPPCWAPASGTWSPGGSACPLPLRTPSSAAWSRGPLSGHEGVLGKALSATSSSRCSPPPSSGLRHRHTLP